MMWTGSTSSWLKSLSLTALLCLASFGASAAPNTATISFTKPTTFSDGTAMTQAQIDAQRFNVYQGIKGQPKTLVGTISTAQSVISSGLLSNTEYCWEIIVTLTGFGESQRSNEGCKAFPQTTPSAVVITVQ